MQFGFYRLHGPDPVYFRENIRVTIQQIGFPEAEKLLQCIQNGTVDSYIQIGDGKTPLTKDDLDNNRRNLFEREDDWSAVSYFYLDKPTNTLPEIEPQEKRIAGLTGDDQTEQQGLPGAI